jgi:hypothetical protein
VFLKVIFATGPLLTKKQTFKFQSLPQPSCLVGGLWWLEAELPLVGYDCVPKIVT